MSLAQGNNTPTRPRIEPGSPDPESNALTTRPVRSPQLQVLTSEKLHLRMKGIGNGDKNNDDPRFTAIQLNSAIALFVLHTCT